MKIVKSEKVPVMAIKPPSSAPIESFMERIFMGLRNISHFSSVYSKYLQKHLDVTTSQLLVLRTLNHENGLSAGEIGRRIFIKPGTITGIVDRLEKKGLAERARGGSDRRVINVFITDAGRELVRLAPVPLQSRLGMNLRKLPIEDVEAVTSSLERLLQLMQTEEVADEIHYTASEDEVF